MRIKFPYLIHCAVLVAFTLTTVECAVFKFSNAICETYNHSLIEINECRLRAISRTRNTLNIHGTFTKAINHVVVEGQILKKANTYLPWLYRARINCCRFIKSPYNPIAVLVFNLFKEFSNFNHTCPYVEFSNINHTCPYYNYVVIDGFYLRSEVLPHAIPSGDYLVNLTFIMDQAPRLNLNFYFEFKED
ncbi:CG33927 [Drosophila busckii]|uniref:CG33927 n=1 Tax=Drosophila busckii TaxID=30019 RepID=A0A0M4E8W3_DROBS|nr:CG33927 [Drosophila busckii]